MSIRRLFVVPSLFVLSLLGISLVLSEEVQAQADVPDWAESRTHAPPPDDAERHEKGRLARRPFQPRPLSPRRTSSEEEGLFSAQPHPNAGPPPPDKPNNEVPLPGSGLVLLGAAGAGYAVRKLSQEDRPSDAE